MKRTNGLLVASTAALALTLAAPSTAHAQVGGGRNFGLGLALGYPDIGLSAQYFMNPRRSLQFVAAFWYRNGYIGRRDLTGDQPADSGIFLRGDYLFHPNVLTRGSVAALEWFVGPGINAGFGFGGSSWFSLGIEGAIGLAVQFLHAPIDITVEFVPRIVLVTSNGFYPDFIPSGTLHARYYF